MLCHSDIIINLASQRLSELLNKNAEFNGEQENKSIISVWIGLKNPSFGLPFCHHSANRMMPSSDPKDGFLYPTLTLMKYFYMGEFFQDYS